MQTEAIGPSIRSENLSLTLGGTPILRNVSLDINAGAIHCIVGPNGSGKTSLIRSLLGQTPHRGKIAIEWGDNRNIGYVPQTLFFEPTIPMTVIDFMTVAEQQRRPVFVGPGQSLRVKIDGVLEAVGMKDKRDRPLGSLSGGERRRVLFAQALIPTPGLLILDEPLAGVDEDGIEVLLTHIRELSAGGTTIVWIAHELDIVRRFATELTALRHELLFTGPFAEVGERLTPRLLFGGDAAA